MTDHSKRELSSHSRGQEPGQAHWRPWAAALFRGMKGTASMHSGVHTHSWTGGLILGSVSPWQQLTKPPNTAPPGESSEERRLQRSKGVCRYLLQFVARMLQDGDATNKIAFRGISKVRSWEEKKSKLLLEHHISQFCSFANSATVTVNWAQRKHFWQIHAIVFVAAATLFSLPCGGLKGAACFFSLWQKQNTKEEKKSKLHPYYK